MENIENLSPKQWEKIWWETYHSKCLDCLLKCKQSSKVVSITCIKFKQGDQSC